MPTMRVEYGLIRPPKTEPLKREPAVPAFTTSEQLRRNLELALVEGGYMRVEDTRTEPGKPPVPLEILQHEEENAPEFVERSEAELMRMWFDSVIMRPLMR